jgi:uncharacterized protein (DUF736 family)
MRKRILDPSRSVRASAEFDGGWLDLRDIATVEVTSEDDRFPIESVFGADGGTGWRASQPGRQLIRIVFDEPASLRRIRLRFVEDESERTQEFSLRWCPAAGGSTEIFRQQWNFSPAGSRTELEEYAVSLEGVSALELAIQPDLNRNDSIATLAEWRVGGHR